MHRLARNPETQPNKILVKLLASLYCISLQDNGEISLLLV